MSVSNLGEGAVLRAGPLDGVEDALDVQAVREGRRGVLVGGDGADEVHHLVDEAVLVAEPVACRPPGLDVRVVRLGDDDAPETGLGGGVRRVVEVEDVHVLNFYDATDTSTEAEIGRAHV